MAETFSLRLPKRSWRAFEIAIDPRKYGPILKKTIGAATKKNALVLQRGIRREIRSGVPPVNAALTSLLKGGNKPLVGTPGADLFNSVTHEVTSWDRAVVGVLRRSEEGADVAQVVHDGVTIRVTERMRGMFYMLWLASRSKVRPHLEGRALELWELGGRWRTKWFRLKPSTVAIVIPPRPYMANAVEDPTTKATIKRNWEKAVEDSLKKAAKAKG